MLLSARSACVLMSLPTTFMSGSIATCPERYSTPSTRRPLAALAQRRSGSGSMRSLVISTSCSPSGSPGRRRRARRDPCGVPLEPAGRVAGNVVPGLVHDLRPVLGDRLRREVEVAVDVAVRLGDEQPRVPATTAEEGFAADRAGLVAQQGHERGDQRGWTAVDHAAACLAVIDARQPCRGYRS